MARVIFFIVLLSAVIYALADWRRTPQESMPGGFQRHLWLIIILITAPTMAIGAWVWIIMRAVLRAEAKQRGEAAEPSLLEEVTSKFHPVDEVAAGPVAPDDDPEFLEKLQREIARQKAHERDAAQRQEQQRRAQAKHSPDVDGHGSADEHRSAGGDDGYRGADSDDEPRIVPTANGEGGRGSEAQEDEAQEDADTGAADASTMDASKKRSPREDEGRPLDENH